MPFTVTIEHTLEELNTILLALAKKPFEEVANLIAKIHVSANEAAANEACLLYTSPSPRD